MQVFINSNNKKGLCHLSRGVWQDSHFLLTMLPWYNWQGKHPRVGGGDRMTKRPKQNCMDDMQSAVMTKGPYNQGPLRKFLLQSLKINGSQ
jgi:hypothetical protein